MGVTAGKDRGMKGQSSLNSEGTKELLDQLKRKETDRLHPARSIIG
jgi:hypothetical protein